MSGKPFQLAIQDFSGGLNSSDSPTLVSDNDSVILQNFDITGRGKLQKRYGYDLVSSGGSGGIRGLLKLTIVGTSPAKYLCIFNNAKLYTITPSNTVWVDQGTYGTDAGERVNGAVFNNLAIFGNGNTANVVRKFDGTTQANLGGTPPKGSIFCVDNHFLNIAGVIASPSVDYWCDTDAPETWAGGVAGNVVISKNDGEAIRALISHNDQFIAIKDFAKHGLDRKFDATELTTGYAQKEIVDRSEGTMAGNSAVSTVQGIIFLGEDKFQSYGFVENYQGARLPENISEKILPTVKGINKAKITRVTGIHDKFRNKVRFGVPIGTSATNTHELIYDLRFASWTINTGLPIADYEYFEDSLGNREIHFGSELEGSVFKFNKKYSDGYDSSTGSGYPIDAIWRGKTFNRFNSSIGFNNWFDRILIRGAITNPFTGYLSITVTNVGQRTTEYIQITESDIIGSGSGGGYVGDSYVGVGYVGGAGTSMGDQALYPFFKEIPFPETINEGREIYLGLQSDRENEGIRLDDIIILGNILPEAIINN